MVYKAVQLVFGIILVADGPPQDSSKMCSNSGFPCTWMTLAEDNTQHQVCFMLCMGSFCIT